MSIISKHPHAHNMFLYAEDAVKSATPWENWQIRSKGTDSGWSDCGAPPLWDFYYEYRQRPTTRKIRQWEIKYTAPNELVRTTGYSTKSAAYRARNHFKEIGGTIVQDVYYAPYEVYV